MIGKSNVFVPSSLPHPFACICTIRGTVGRNERSGGEIGKRTATYRLGASIQQAVCTLHCSVLHGTTEMVFGTISRIEETSTRQFRTAEDGANTSARGSKRSQGEELLHASQASATVVHR